MSCTHTTDIAVQTRGWLNAKLILPRQAQYVPFPNESQTPFHHIFTECFRIPTTIQRSAILINKRDAGERVLTERSPASARNVPGGFWPLLFLIIASGRPARICCFREERCLLVILLFLAALAYNMKATMTKIEERFSARPTTPVTWNNNQ